MPRVRRATITLPDDLDRRVEAFRREQELEPSLTALVQAALRRYLDDAEWSRRSYRPASRSLRITPARSGTTDAAAEHDSVLAEP